MAAPAKSISQLPRDLGTSLTTVATALLTLEDLAGKTRYSVMVLHKDEAGRKLHERMGFHEGWNTVLDQL